MKIWQQYTTDEKLVMLQQTATANKILEQAVEKDWWVTTVLMALSKSSLSEYLQFKGGTSLSKAWGLIKRFSEDIDLAISRSFFNLSDKTPQQRTAIRRKAFHYIKETLVNELNKILSDNGINNFEINFFTENSSAMVAVVEIRYKSILTTIIDYVLPVVKIEFNVMSLDEPYQEKCLTTLINSTFTEIDNEIKCTFKSVLPERTFLEKIFLLHEEYQKIKPRTTRMSRHLYDLEKIMDTPFAQSALQNRELYETIIQHRQTFNDIKSIDYKHHSPDFIQIIPPESLIDSWKEDYERMKQSFIYEEPQKTFEEIIDRLQILTDRIKQINN